MMVVIARHPIYSALFLVLTFIGQSLFYLQLQAPFLAAVQVIVYAGAIMVLFVFVIMLLGEDKPMRGEQHVRVPTVIGIAFCVFLIAEIGWMIGNQGNLPASHTVAPVTVVSMAGQTGETVEFGSVKAIGNTLFTDYLFAFEATSIVLLVAMIGVVVLAKRRL